MLTRAETGSRGDGNLVPPLQFSINLEHLKYKVNYLKKANTDKAMGVFMGTQMREEQGQLLIWTLQGTWLS